MVKITKKQEISAFLGLNSVYFFVGVVSCNNIHRDVTDSVNHGMVKKAKTWISWERNIIFLWNKKILNLCLRWHILRSYCFVAEVTFKEQYRTVFWLVDHIYLFYFLKFVFTLLFVWSYAILCLLLFFAHERVM